MSSGQAESKNNRVVYGLLALVLFMGVAAWGAVPFYTWFCRTTGYGGTTNTATTGSDVILDQEVTIRFDANVDRNLGWTFRPMQRAMKVKLGETGLAFYEAINNTDESIIGAASYNVAPSEAGYYFDKIECFCFTEQTLAPHERVEMPVSFYVDPDILKDTDAKAIRFITLSYTFHKTPDQKPRVEARLDETETSQLN